MFEVKFSTVAEKKFFKLENLIQDRIKISLERIRIRPRDYLKHLVGSPFYSLRVGDYRLIIDINAKELIVLVIDLGHRKDVYDK